MTPTEPRPKPFWRGQPKWNIAAMAASWVLLLTAIVVSILHAEFMQKIWDVAIIATAISTISWGVRRSRIDRSEDER